MRLRLAVGPEQRDDIAGGGEFQGVGHRESRPGPQVAPAQWARPLIASGYEEAG
ncbi:hypothetical protein ACWKT3_03605 [Streptomyces violaceus]